VTRLRCTAAAAVLVAILLVAAVLVGPADPAWARATVVASTPADGAALSAAPATVDLAFSVTPEVDSSHAAARTGAGVPVASGPLRRTGPATLRLPVSITAAGDYLIAYHVEFTDGTDLVGVLRFSVGTGVPPVQTDAAARRAAQDLTAVHHHDIDPLSAILLVADGVVLLGAILLLWGRNRGRAPARQ
jgi:methionine-rich copper-binding protein CopC